VTQGDGIRTLHREVLKKEATLWCGPTLRCDELETTADQESQNELRLLVLGFLQLAYACCRLILMHPPEPAPLLSQAGRFPLPQGRFADCFLNPKGLLNTVRILSYSHAQQESHRAHLNVWNRNPPAPTSTPQSVMSSITYLPGKAHGGTPR